MFKLITAPAVEPVTVSELKSQLRITGTSQDTMLLALTKSARQNVEDYLRYSLISATWELYLDSFPKAGECLWIQKVPVTAITTLTYNLNGTMTALTENTDFVSDFNSKPCRLFEAYGKSWPSARNIRNSVVVRFVSGYANAAAVPDLIKQEILMIAATMYEIPTDEMTGTQVNKVYNNSLRILSSLRSFRY